MDSTLRRPHACPVCGHTERETLFVTRDRHYRIAGQWNVGRCTSCGMVQLDPMPTTEELMSLYPKDFYAYQDLSAKNKGSIAWVKRKVFQSLYVKDPAFIRPGRVLDSGCGTGWALLQFKDAGWECLGLEPSESAACFGRDHYGLDVRCGTVHSVCLPNEHFDYIRSNHSLEHDPLADATIAEFRRLIKLDGKLLIGVPNIASWPARWFGRYWWYLGAPVHTYNFSPKHLQRLLEKHSFQVESIRFAGNFGGLLGSLQIFLNRNDPNKISTDGFPFNLTAMKILAQILSTPLNWIGKGDAIEVVARPIDGAVR